MPVDADPIVRDVPATTPRDVLAEPYTMVAAIMLLVNELISILGSGIKY